MSIETLIYDALRALVDDRVYPDIAPDDCDRPYITYQQVGGRAINFIDPTVPGKRNARVQINVWADTRLEVSTLAGAIENALRAEEALQTSVLGAAVSEYDMETKLRGSRQDFSVWN